MLMPPDPSVAQGPRGVRVRFGDDGWADHLHWSQKDAALRHRLDDLIEDGRPHHC